MNFVIYADDEKEINLLISDEDEVLINKLIKIDHGINYISHNLFIDDKNKYLSKGEYSIKVVNLDEVDQVKFTIN